MLPALRARLRRVATPWYDEDGGDGGGGSNAKDLQVAVHLRRGDLSSHGLESDQSRWVVTDTDTDTDADNMQMQIQMQIQMQMQMQIQIQI